MKINSTMYYQQSEMLPSSLLKAPRCTGYTSTNYISFTEMYSDLWTYVCIMNLHCIYSCKISVTPQLFKNGLKPKRKLVKNLNFAVTEKVQGAFFSSLVFDSLTNLVSSSVSSRIYVHGRCMGFFNLKGQVRDDRLNLLANGELYPLLDGLKVSNESKNISLFQC